MIVFLRVVLSLILILPIILHAQLPAFPGAQGFGAYAIGGRGGDVYHVTNLDDDGPGSLRYGIETTNGPRTIVFDISGNIELLSDLRIKHPYITLAGQTAPDPGVLIQNYGLIVSDDHIIIRHMRFRPGDKYIGPHDEGGFTEDALTLGGNHIIADHVSASWSVDEDLSCGTAWDSVTIQYCLIAEALHKTEYFHGEYVPDHSGHSMGSLIKVRGSDAKASLHHNLWAHNNNRNPAVGSYDTTEYVRVDVRSNVMYNCGTFGYSSGGSKQVDMNYIGNYIIAGKSTSSSNRTRAFKAYDPNNMQIYQAQNKIDSNLDAVRDGSDTGWNMFVGDYTQSGQEFHMSEVETHSADESYGIVLSRSGAYPWSRDSVDIRILADVQNNTGSIIDSQEEVGSYQILEKHTRAADWDTDHDGMPDWWEDEQGLDKTNPSDRNDDKNLDGYTNLETYLNHFDLLTNMETGQIPRSYQLKLDSYPNPFNNNTSITYTLPKNSHVRLSIYSIAGQKIYELVDENKLAGKYDISFSGDDLASGMYFLSLAANDQLITKKISLIK